MSEEFEERVRAVSERVSHIKSEIENLRMVADKITKYVSEVDRLAEDLGKIKALLDLHLLDFRICDEFGMYRVYITQYIPLSFNVNSNAQIKEIKEEARKVVVDNVYNIVKSAVALLQKIADEAGVSIREINYKLSTLKNEIKEIESELGEEEEEEEEEEEDC